MLRASLLGFLIVVAHVLQAAPISAALPGAALRGEATFRYLGVALYQARLYTPSGARLNWDSDFAIELTYLRYLRKGDLVDSTLSELDRTGPALPLRVALTRCYRDVHPGDRFTAISDGPDQLGMWLNGNQTCTLTHPDIKARFMGIFLGDDTRSRRFTRQLRGD